MIKAQAWGNLSADPELRTVAVGEEKRSFCVFTVMSNRHGKDTPDALRVEVWGAMAENVAKYLKKGSGVAVAGDLAIEPYEKDDVKRLAVKLVNVDTVQFTDKVTKKAE